MSTTPIPGKISLLSLDSVTRVRAARTDWAGPLANDLQKLTQEINELHRSIAALTPASPSDTPITPSSLSDFLLPPAPDFRDDGAMDVAVQALTMADIPVAGQPQSPQIIFCTQATFPTLSAVAANTLIAVTDYAHLIYWDGTTPTFSDDGSGWVAEGKPDGSAPAGGLWGLCDGTAYNCLKADGTLASITTINRTLNSFPEGSTVFGAKAASRATWEAAAVTDDESSHTHQIDPPNTTSTADSDIGALITVVAGPTKVALNPHTHDTDITAFTSSAGSAHHHVLSDSNAQLKVFSETNGGLPARVGVSYWIRR